MPSDTAMLDLSSLDRAIARLEEALQFYHSDLAKGDTRLATHLRAAVIQAFEFTYELAFKTLKRGTLVGQQTYGGVISTGGTSLLDGTTVRLPFRGWYLADGTDMENHGAMPDLVVPQTPEDESKNFDAQLKAAVDDLLKRSK